MRGAAESENRAVPPRDRESHGVDYRVTRLHPTSDSTLRRRREGEISYRLACWVERERGTTLMRSRQRSAAAALPAYERASGTVSIVTCRKRLAAFIRPARLRPIRVPSSLLLLLRRRVRLLLDDVSGGHDPLRRHKPILKRSSACRLVFVRIVQHSIARSSGGRGLTTRRDARRGGACSSLAPQ